MKKSKGITVVELMITLAIGAVLLAVAVPSFREFIANNRLVTQTNSMVAAINLARSEAIKAGSTVTMCTVSSTSATDCNGAASWSQGWIVFSDVNADGGTDPAGAPCGTDQDCMAQVGEGMGGSSTVASAGFASATSLQFTATGALVGTPGTLTICDDRSKGRMISVNTVGRISTTDATGCP